jgi:hypothetical protein
MADLVDVRMIRDIFMVEDRWGLWRYFYKHNFTLNATNTQNVTKRRLVNYDDE